MNTRLQRLGVAAAASALGAGLIELAFFLDGAQPAFTPTSAYPEKV